jgi:cobalt-precorrin 5A hydrolase
MGSHEAMIVAGIGARAGCAAEDIVRVVRAATEQAGVEISVLAAPDFKCAEDGVQQAALLLDVPLVAVTRTILQAVQPRCPTRSSRAEAATGIASVAEGCALAAAGANGRLILPRISHGSATCALAAGDLP